MTQEGEERAVSGCISSTLKHVSPQNDFKKTTTHNKINITELLSKKGVSVCLAEQDQIQKVLLVNTYRCGHLLDSF